jgi:DNA modification methylase
VSLIRADARALPLRENCVQCVVTSPPYFGLRDYGTATWEGGDPACDHVSYYGPPLNKSTLTSAGIGATPDGAASKAHAKQFRDVCGKCGARRVDRQIGLEPTPDAYVSALVEVFRGVWRVLRDDGVCWLNLGDSYAGGGGYSPDSPSNQPDAARARRAPGAQISGARISGTRTPIGLKPKDLCGIPWRVAFALQAAGWYLRSDIIWSKPNPMPESVTDRPTKAHEYVFLLTKSERYYWDADAVREPVAQFLSTTGEPAPRARYGGIMPAERRGGFYDPARHGRGAPDGRVMKEPSPNGRNVRSVWSIATQSYSGAHFATMPEKLVERCVLAGSRPGDLVLDPFMGSGTVGRVALSLGRRAVGCDLNREYLALADERLTVTRGLPLEVA